MEQNTGQAENMALQEQQPEAVHTVIWTVVGTIAATALAFYYPLIFLLVFLLAVFGGGLPWMMSGSPSDKQMATIVVLSTLFAALISVAWIVVSRNLAF